MRRWIAILWHASFLVIAGGLYFFFVLPRWYELLGDWSSTLGTVVRIVCGVLIGLAALPVVFTWLRTRKPEFGTPELALRLRVAAIVLHVVAGVLIVAAAISEIWLTLDDVGQWLFGVYGAAAALALLGALGFYLAFAAELPPPPPKPLKPRAQTRARSRFAPSSGSDSDDEAGPAGEPAESADAPEAAEVSATDEAVEADDGAVGNAEDAGDDKASEENDAEENDAEANDAEASDAEESGKLRNRRPGGKSSSRLFRRSRGGVALDD